MTMPGSIYLIGNNDELIEMTEKEYDSEKLLQELLAKYPSLLAGDQVSPDRPRRWLFVAREVPVPSEEGGAAGLHLDHLFLDQDAVPTLIEVKRSTNSDIRRKVIGQMLDYASNAVANWSAEWIQGLLKDTCDVQGTTVEDALASLVEPGMDVDDFWEKVDHNLKAGCVRLVFVADQIPPSLRRVVEYLNEQMGETEVLGLEVKQFVGANGEKIMVPRVYGLSKVQPPPTQWNEDSFFGTLGAKAKGSGATSVAREVLKWCRAEGLQVYWGNGKQDGSFTPGLKHGSKAYYPFAVWTSGRIEFLFYWMQNWPPFDDIEKRREMAKKLNAITNEIPFDDDALNRRPSVSLAVFKEPERLKALLDVLEWFVDQARTAE
jgi:hypothetical protein